MINLGFKELLIFGTPLLAIIFTLLLIKRSECNELLIFKRRNLLPYIHYSLVSAFVIISVYSVYAGSRPLLYFVLVGALFVTSILYGKNSSERVFPKTLFLTASIMAITIPAVIIVGNHFYPYRGLEHSSLLPTGRLELQKSEFYYYIPIGLLIQVSAALVTGQTMLAPLIFDSIFMLGMVTGILSSSRRLSHNTLTGIIGAFFFMSIPSLTFFGRIYSLTYAIFYILLTALLYESPSASILGLWIVSLPMIFMHPSGFIAVITLFLPLALLGIQNWPERERSSKRIRLSVLITIVLAFSYWIHTYLISLMTRVGGKFYSTIYSYFSGVTAWESAGGGIGQGYVPRYYLAGYEIFAYAWSVPVALSAALLLSFIFRFIRKKKFDPSQSLIMVSAFAGPLIVLLGYLASTGETGQYLYSVAYFLLLLPSSVAAAKLLTNCKKNYAIVAMLLISFFITIGTYSPNWAPLEHPDFEVSATIHPYHVYLEAETVTSLIPMDATVYGDYDFSIGGGGEYKPIRNIILQICSEADLVQFARSPITLYGMREERISKGLIRDWDIMYSSGYHRIIAGK